MAVLFFGVTGPTLDLTEELTIADSDAPRIMAYLMASPHGKITENIQTSIPDASWAPSEDQTEDDRPNILTQEWVTRQATPDETAANYAKSILSQLLAETVVHEKAVATSLAAEAVSPIEIIPT